tara:strand:+ start:14958 stop:15959 length:1002 start_codon:yes stop_codon:yes gene_type:complete
MIISKSPFRIAFAGGGTDIDEFSNLEGGEVINATINLGCYTFIESSSEIKFKSQDLNISEKYNLPEQKLKLHSATYKKMMNLYNNGAEEKLSVTTYSEVPPGSGVGASSSMVVSMVSCIAKYLDVELDSHKIAEIAYEIERIDCGLSGGKQDQYSASFGGFNNIKFYKDGKVSVEELKIDDKDLIELQSNIILFYTGQSRASEKIIDTQKKSIVTKKEITLESLLSIKELVLPMRKALEKLDIKEINNIFNQSWKHKKLTSSLITNDEINSLIEKLLDIGVESAKISGAGGGGFMVILVKPSKRKEVTDYLRNKEGVVYNINFVKEGAYSWEI